jgi:hypothetical protein
MMSETAQSPAFERPPGIGHNGGPPLLVDYVPEDEYCADTNQSRRKARQDRQWGLGPPYVVIARKVYYPRAGIMEWLKSLERHPLRGRKAA